MRPLSSLSLLAYALIFLAMPPPAHAAEGIEGVKDIDQIPLVDLLDAEVSVGTLGKAVAARLAPGAVYVITREDLDRLAARDLIDVLRLVPGFDVAVDNFSTPTVGVRGIWSSEGKVLVLFDGHESHELLYFFTVLANRFPMDWIERVEVIRGPGSATYGGAAGLAVVNIVLRNAEQLDGLSVEGRYGQLLGGLAEGESLEDTYARRTLSLSFGQVFDVPGELALRLQAFGGQSQRSDGDYADFFGNEFNLSGQAPADPLMVNLAVDWYGLSLRYLFELYRTKQRDSYEEAITAPKQSDFYYSSAALSYGFDLGPVHIEPKLRHVWQKPWLSTGAEAEALGGYWDPTVQRVQGLVSASYEWPKIVSVSSGLEYTFDYAIDEQWGFIDPHDTDAWHDDISTHNFAATLEAVFLAPWVDVSAGVRFEYHSVYEDSVAPRLGLSSTFGDFYFKTLFSQAFRVPNFVTLQYNLPPRAEQTTAIELELGYEILESLRAVLNLYRFTIADTIVYSYDAVNDVEYYDNAGELGATGLEASVRFDDGTFFADLGYSVYTTAWHDIVANFQVPDDDSRALAFAPHKLTLSAGWDVTDAFTLGLASTLAIGRKGYTAVDAEGNPRIEERDPELQLDATATYRDLFVDGLSASLSVFNATAAERVYLQPYAGLHAPFPQPSTEIMLRLRYELGL